MLLELLFRDQQKKRAFTLSSFGVILIFKWMQRRFQQLTNRFLQGSWIHLFHNFLNCHSGEVWRLFFGSVCL
ncbi:hypothetical protein NC653_009350 [Populus alba x Populus x berolinensis]|uniref:Uncharacterized protein n=1 Tax=Populus alba x Populus x berolinensis TaxID=444605 RepID=A0AAD6R8X5_9ROSI|nr:hypothetical protein NC653_009350 [Populus alba x Populus x berolinensis]